MALAAPLPTGAVTFAFTDIEGSTARWDRDRAAMQEALRRHDELLRSIVAQHNGHVFKTLGDAFYCAFARPQDAIVAAVDAQRALQSEDFSAVGGLRVRMALHIGNADERDGDYFGPSVNRVARLLAIGHGGQVLLSRAAQASIAANLPGDITLIDLGLRRLKGLSQPEEVWQLSIAGLRSDFPPLDSLDARPNNLPVQVTPLIGREQELEHVKGLIDAHRVVSILGSGGVGKTRLALQAGADLIDRFDHGVWFADLSPIRDPELVASVVARILSISAPEDQRLDEVIPQALKRKQLLLILDNCEQVLDTAAALADAIHHAAPQVHILATSRQALEIAGEAAYRLPSLAVPDASVSVDAKEALRYGAIGVFVERARLADTHFSLTDATAPIVAEVCRRLDGIPLAIELAAARVRVLPIPTLAQRLNERFTLLTGGSRTALPRQKTLSALIDWSYDLLTPQEQLLFSRVGIFAGGFGLDAATAVCSGGDLDDTDILDLVASLTDKSLVVADTSGEQERYSLLESTRAYALEKLAAEGAHEQLARRHAEYFRDQSQVVDERYFTGFSEAWLTSVELELDNYRAVLEWALKDGHDLVLGGAVAGALTGLWFDGGLAVEGRYWIGLAQADLDESAHPQVAARMWRALSVLSSGKREHECAQRALALYESLGDETGQAWALHSLAWSLFQMGGLREAGDANARALAAMRSLRSNQGVAGCLNQQGMIQWAHGDVAAARESYAQALPAYKALRSDGTAVVLGNLAELEFGEGQVEQALRLAGEALEIRLPGKNSSLLAFSYVNIAAYRVAAGDLDGARAAAREGLRLARQVQRAVQIAIALQHLALLLALLGEVNDAAHLVGYVNVQFEELGYEREATEKWGYEKLMAALHEQLSDAQIEKLAAEGAAWTEDQAVEEALKV